MKNTIEEQYEENLEELDQELNNNYDDLTKNKNEYSIYDPRANIKTQSYQPDDTENLLNLQEDEANRIDANNMEYRLKRDANDDEIEEDYALRMELEQELQNNLDDENELEQRQASQQKQEFVQDNDNGNDNDNKKDDNEYDLPHQKEAQSSIDQNYNNAMHQLRQNIKDSEEEIIRHNANLKNKNKNRNNIRNI